MQELTATSLTWIGHDLVPASLHGPLARELSAWQDKGGKGGRELLLADPKKQYNAFVRSNNLYVEDIASKTERALTKDGSEAVRNGKTDWVYWEEVYNRGNSRHFWWGPDGAHIAFIRLDDTPVPKATVVDYAKPVQ